VSVWKRERPSWDAYFLGVAKAVAARADCRRRAVGAVLVDVGHRIASTGYNGARAGSPGCLEGNCPRGLLSYERVAEFTSYDDPTSPGYCISTHAEVNALLYAKGPVQGCTVYVTDPPCPGCTKVLRNAGVHAVVYPEPGKPHQLVNVFL
jgi:dCMP deaminase